jgi:arginine exporter protein ArgO
MKTNGRRVQVIQAPVILSASDWALIIAAIYKTPLLISEKDWMIDVLNVGSGRAGIELEREIADENEKQS